MKAIKFIGIASAIATVVAAGVAVYTKAKSNKIKMDEEMEAEVREEIVESIEKVNEIAEQVTFVAGVVTASAYAASIFTKKKPAPFNQEAAVNDFVALMDEFMRDANSKFIKEVTDAGINMHGLTENSRINSITDAYQTCYQDFLNNHTTGDKFTSDLADMLNIHNLFVRADLADAITGGRLYA